MKKLITTLSVLALASALSIAEDKPAGPPPGGKDGGPGDKHPKPEEVFKKLDTNHDGSLSLEEFKAGPKAKQDPAKAEEIFKKMDKGGDGKVTLEEFKQAHHPPHDGPGGPGGDKKGPGGPPHKGPGDGGGKPAAK